MIPVLSSSDTDRYRNAEPVATQYLRRERPLSTLLVVLAVSVFLGAYLTTSLVPAMGVAVVEVVVLRMPVLRTHGTARLSTDDDPDAVRAAFAGPRPPVLALQWGIADEVAAEDDTATYTISYLFGLRSTELAVRTRTATIDGGERVELEVTENGRPWGSYTATIRRDGDRTTVDIEYGSDRRTGLRRLPQTLVARRYRDEILEAQGYTVLERHSHIV
ncbi:putative membrane protein [Halapricum desulfuricans]|uniref:Putative membrane protein n=1 Tax=Halapricum desulfuricans TaxID=2841257 RepID=A0A897NQL0_9EURY|nr:putative membrane protein [Halapricum desulfuricans]